MILHEYCVTGLWEASRLSVPPAVVWVTPLKSTASPLRLWTQGSPTVSLILQCLHPQKTGREPQRWLGAWASTGPWDIDSTSGNLLKHCLFSKTNMYIVENKRHELSSVFLTYGFWFIPNSLSAGELAVSGSTWWNVWDVPSRINSLGFVGSSLLLPAQPCHLTM